MNTFRLVLALFALPGATTLAHAAALAHRYEFNGNLKDSVGAAHAAGTVAGGLTAAVSYDAARPAGASGPLASVQVGQAKGQISGFTLPATALPAVGSLSFWFKAGRSEAGEGADYLLNMGGTYNKGLRVAIAAGKSIVEANVANTNTYLGRIADGEWHHVVLTWDEAAGAASLYFDGALVKNREWGDPALFSPMPLRVGNWAFADRYADNQFSGAFYDLQIYTGRLDASEVRRLHAAPGGVIGSTRP